VKVFTLLDTPTVDPACPDATRPARWKGPSVRAQGVWAAVLLATFSLVGEFLIWPDWDATWFLMIARQIQAGATVYSNELIEINPPTMIEFARLALAVSEPLGITAVTAWRLLVFTCMLASLGLSLALLRRALEPEDTTLFLPAAVVFAIALGVIPGMSFGQREHIIVLLMTPYVLAAALHADGRRPALVLSLACGVMLGVAMTIKPHYALIVLSVEAVVVLQTRQPRGILRAETLGAAATAVVLAPALLARYPGYLSVAVPYALRYYEDYDELVLSLPHGGYVAGGTAAIAAIGWLGLRPAVPVTLYAAGLGAVVAFLAQRKGWDYHFLPARSFLLLASGLALLRAGRAAFEPRLAHRSKVPFGRLMSAVAVAMMLGVSALMVRRTNNINGGHWAGQFGRLQALFESLRPEARPLSVATFSLELYPALPVTEVMNGEWASRFSCLWMVRAIEARERAGGDDALPQHSGRSDLIAAVAEDLRRRRPTFVLIEEGRSRVLDEIVAAEPVQDALRAYRRAAQLDELGVWVRGESSDPDDR